MQKALKIRLDTSKTRRLCPSEISPAILRRLMGEKNRLKAERARFLSRRERRAKTETEPLLPDLWPSQWTQISGGSKGVGPLGRRAGMKVLPEKGRQRAVSGVRRVLEGGKRSCSPSKVLVGAKEA